MGKIERTRVAVLEPNERWRQHLRLLIGETSGLACAEVAQCLEQIIPALSGGGVDLVVVGFEHGGLPGSLIADVRRFAPSIPVVAVGFVAKPHLLISLLISGADAVVSKDESSLQVLEAIETVREGGAYLSVSLAKLLVDALRTSVKERQHLEGLSARELEVLQWLATGLTDHQIAGRLGIAPRTVSTHLQNIYGKIGVRTRSAAVARYFGQRTSAPRLGDAAEITLPAKSLTRSASLAAFVEP